jgi:hypothetical protein
VAEKEEAVEMVVEEVERERGKYKSCKSARARSMRRAMLAGMVSKQVSREYRRSRADWGLDGWGRMVERRLEGKV